MVTQEGEIRFRGEALTRFRAGRQALLLAHQVGRALGYERGGRTLLDKVTGRWAAELDAVNGRYVLEGADVAAFDKAFPGMLREITTSRNPFRVVFLTRAGIKKLVQWANVERRSGLMELFKLCVLLMPVPLPVPATEPGSRQLALPEAGKSRTAEIQGPDGQTHRVPILNPLLAAPPESRDTAPEPDEDSAARRGRPGAVLTPLEPNNDTAADGLYAPERVSGQERPLQWATDRWVKDERPVAVAGPEVDRSPPAPAISLVSEDSPPSAIDATAETRALRLQVYLVNAQADLVRAQTEHTRALVELEAARAARIGQQIALVAARAGITDAEPEEVAGDLVDVEPVPDGFRRATGLLNDFADPGLALATIDAIVRTHLGRVLAPADVVLVPVQRSGDDARTSWVRAYSKRAANLIRQAVPAYLTPLDRDLGTARQREYTRRRAAAGLPPPTFFARSAEDLVAVATLDREAAGRIGDAIHTAKCRFWRRNPRDPDSEILVASEFVARFLGRPLEKTG